MVANGVTRSQSGGRRRSSNAGHCGGAISDSLVRHVQKRLSAVLLGLFRRFRKAEKAINKVLVTILNLAAGFIRGPFN